MHLPVWFRIYFSLLAGIFVWPAVLQGQSDSVPLHYHFAGRTAVAGDSNLIVLSKVLTLPSTAGLQRAIAESAATWLANSLRFETNGSATSLFEPLICDVFQTESVGDFDDSSTKAPSFVMALRLDSKRQQLWQSTLSKALGNSPSFWVKSAGEWLLVGRGDDLRPLREKYLRQIELRGRPVAALKENWLEVDVDASRLNVWPRLLKPARLAAQLSTKAGNLQWDARLTYSDPVKWRSSLWQLPTGMVRNPLISFTAAQNLAAFLNLDTKTAQLAGNPLTNQFYAWALGQMPFQTYAAWPTADPTNVLQEFARQALPDFNADLQSYNHTQLDWMPQYRRLLLSGLRVVVPALGIGHDGNRPFLLMSLFPLSAKNEPAPPQLWEQVRGRTNLVYYDWELTGPRLQQWRLLGHILFDRFAPHSAAAVDTMHIEEQWLGALGPSLGNTVTEITQVSPNELLISRNAPIGCTASELFLFCNWLSGRGL